MAIEVVPYNPEWSEWFKNITTPIWDSVREYIIDIVHIGSTSIVGMSAKPCIDIDIVIDDWVNFPKVIEGLALLGYEHIGDLGIKEREAFKHAASIYRHNLYVVHVDSIAYRNHIALKNHLYENPNDFQRYIDLKLELSNSSVDIDQYCRLKTNIILDFLEAEGFTAEELEEIRLQNLS
ncbi:MAG: hypothetical protein GF329_12215 [Candidatus Lokiarchaeota archaeon]|nr:hypothetical protein [Candidatus Lokiarchaeota archaeon]